LLLRLFDLGDLAVAIARQAIAVARQLTVELLDLLRAASLLQRVAVEDLALGHLRLIDLARLGDGGLLRVRERALLDAGLAVFLPQALHRELVGALRAVGHRAEFNPRPPPIEEHRRACARRRARVSRRERAGAERRPPGWTPAPRAAVRRECRPPGAPGGRAGRGRATGRSSRRRMRRSRARSARSR